MVPADGNAGNGQDGNAYPWMGVDSVIVESWAQNVNGQPPVPVAFRANQVAVAPDSGTGVDGINLTVALNPTTPYLVVNHQASPHLGESWSAQATISNYGAAGDSATVAVVSNRPDIIPSFSVQVGSVGPLGTTTCAAMELVPISDSPGAMGALVQLVYAFPANFSYDTVFVSLPFGEPWPSHLTGLRVANSQGNLVVVAKRWNTVAAYHNHAQVWQRTLTDTIRAISISSDALRVGVVTAGGWVYQLSATDGQGLQSWQVTAATAAKPEVFFFVYDSVEYIGYIRDATCYMFDGSGQPPPNRDQFTLPIAPNGVSIGRDASGLYFALTGGDLSSGTDGSFIVVDSIGAPVFQSDVYPTKAFTEPISGDRNGDGRLDWMAHCIGQTNGLATISYSFIHDSVGLGLLNYYAYVRPLFGNLCLSRSASVQNIGPAVVTSLVYTTGTYNNCIMVLGGNASAIALRPDSLWFVSSINFDGSSQCAVTVSLPRRNQVQAYGHDGNSLYPGGTPIVDDAGSGSYRTNGPFLSVFHQPTNRWEVLVPMVSDTDWTFRTYATQGWGADWAGTDGNGQNTRCHAFRGGPPPCQQPDTVTLTAHPAEGMLVLQWTACYLNQVLGYHLYSALTPDASEGEWIEITDVTINPVPGTDYAAWVAIPIASLGPKLFFRVIADLAEAPPVPDGSGYWGMHQLE